MRDVDSYYLHWLCHFGEGEKQPSCQNPKKKFNFFFLDVNLFWRNLKIMSTENRKWTFNHIKPEQFFKIGVYKLKTVNNLF